MMSNVQNVFRELFLEGYAMVDLTMQIVIGCILCTLFIAGYIFIVYKWINKKTFYNKNFNLSLVALAIITAAVILTIQSNIVVSLGMVGALSIVRFRTAIKDPLDLIFLFWSIAVGIICGAGFAAIAFVASFVLTIVIFVFSNMKMTKESQILVINSQSYEVEESIMKVIEKNCSYFRLRAKTISRNDMNLAIEIKAENQKELMDELVELSHITSISLLEHDGEVTV